MRSKEEIVTKISEITEENLGYPVEKDEKIFERGNIDSLDMISIIMDIEKEFDIEISDHKVNQFVEEGLSIDQLADKLMSNYDI